MPPRTKKDPAAPTTMKELKDTLWKAADKLRGSMDASQYKDVILGLVFLKYVSDAYAERRAQIRAELAEQGMDEDQVEQLIDDPEEYHGYGVFVVPPTARWTYLAQNAKGRPAAQREQAMTVGALVDDAMSLVMGANPSLVGTLPRIFNRDNVDQRRLGELIDLFNSARFSRQGEGRARDLLGEVYEYFLEAFARAEGKRGGEFYTPASVVKVLVEVLEPSRGRVYDPCCGSGGMFVQTEKFIFEHDGDPKDVVIYGQESKERHLAVGQDEPGHPRHRQRRAAQPVGRHVRRRLPRWCPDGLRHGQSAVQHQGLAPGREGRPLDLRRAARRQCQLRVDPAHPLQARTGGPRRCRHGQRVDVDEQRGRRRHPCPDRRGRPRVVHGGVAHAAVPVHRDPGVSVVLRAGQGGWGAGLGRPHGAGAVRRRPQPRVHGGPRRTGPCTRGHRAHRGHVPRLARFTLRTRQGDRVCRRPRLLRVGRLGGHQGR